MTTRLPHALTALPALLAVLLLAACQMDARGSGGYGAPIERDLAQIVERDTLTALLVSNSTSYFVYRGEPMGFEYELLRAFARERDLTLNVRVVADPDSLFPMLLAGAGDVVGARLVPRAFEGAPVRFTEPLYRTQPTVVQSTGQPDIPASVEATLDEGATAAGVEDGLTRPGADLVPGQVPEEFHVEARLIRQPEDLVGETVVLEEGSPYSKTLLELSDSVSGDIYVVEASGVSLETLMQSVSLDQIDLTVAPENLAMLQAEMYSNLVVQPTIAEPHDVAWAVRPNSPALLAEFNAWLNHPNQEARLRTLYRKYFVDRARYRARRESRYLSSVTGTLSDYDHLFKRYAEEIDWDWRLLASQAYQESKFDISARSWAGAQGLLQLMPPTAREFGVTNANDPDQNVAGAVRFIAWLQRYWADKIPDPQENLKFVLASYNTGHGHVEDARRLTARAGADDTVWANVAYWLLQKSDPAVYRLPVVRFGFSRGYEPVHYVDIILDRFAHYRQFVTPEERAAAAPAASARARAEARAPDGPRGVR